MKATSSGLAILALFASLTGCAMCQSPFDYVGPVVGASGCPTNYNFGARRGSEFAPQADDPPLTLSPTVANPAAAPTEESPTELPAGENTAYTETDDELTTR